MINTNTNTATLDQLAIARLRDSDLYSIRIADQWLPLEGATVSITQNDVAAGRKAAKGAGATFASIVMTIVMGLVGLVVGTVVSGIVSLIFWLLFFPLAILIMVGGAIAGAIFFGLAGAMGGFEAVMDKDKYKRTLTVTHTDTDEYTVSLDGEEECKEADEFHEFFKSAQMDNSGVLLSQGI